MPASGSSLCSSLSPVLLAHKPAWKTLMLVVDWCTEEFHWTRKSCVSWFLKVKVTVTASWHSSLPAAHAVCHSFSISGLVVVPFLYLSSSCWVCFLFHTRRGFFCVRKLLFHWDPCFVFLSKWYLWVPSIFPSISVSSFQCMASCLFPFATTGSLDLFSSVGDSVFRELIF